LIQRYLDGAQEERSPDILSKYEMAVQCAMEARYHFQNGDYRKAEECASQCICNAKPFLEDETKRSDAWLLVQLSLKNIKDTEKARLALERLLPDTGQ
jgi:tetratricopeptide (TPR) repeat protein